MTVLVLPPGVRRILSLLFVAVALATQPSLAQTTTDISGKVTARRENQLRVEFEPHAQAAPATGDAVDFKTEIRGIVVAAGRGEIVDADASGAWVRVLERSPGLGMNAVIHASGMRDADAVLDQVRDRMAAGDCRESDIATLTAYAKAGSLRAQNNLGISYDRGCGVVQDPRVATEWLLKAAEGGLPQAMGAVAFRYGAGSGVTADPSAALDWARRGAAAGHPFGHWALANALSRGWGTEVDMVASNVELRKAAEGSLAFAQTELAVRHLNGVGTARDASQALVWARRAVEQNDPRAMDVLAFLYEHGFGTSRNLDEAARLYERAIAAGYDSKANLERVRRQRAGRAGTGGSGGGAPADPKPLYKE